MSKDTHTSFKTPMSLKVWHWLTPTDEYGTVHVFALGTSSNETITLPSLLKDTKGWNNDVTHVKPISIRFKRTSTGLFPEDAILHVNSGSLTYDYVTDREGLHPYSQMSRVTCERGRMLTEQFTAQAHFNTAGEEYPVTWGYFAQEWLEDSIDGDFVRWTTKVYSGDFQQWIPRNIPFEPPSKEGLLRAEGAKRKQTEWSYFSWLNELEVVYDLPTYTSAELVQLFHEKSWIFGPYERPQKVTELMANAFYDAFQQFPKFNDNNVANLKEMMELVVDCAKSGGVAPLLGAAESLVDFLKGGNRPRVIAQDLGDLWLQYRYCYGTTKSDVKQALENKARNQITYLRAQHFNGKYSRKILTPDGDGYVDVECRVGFDVVQQTLDMVRAFRHYGYLHGLEVNAYTLWDLVPFSFMVDWVCDVGGELQKQQDIDHYSDYIFTNVVWSLKYTRMLHNVENVCYSRWYDNHIPTEGIAMSDRTSGKTWIKRGADVVSITI